MATPSCDDVLKDCSAALQAQKEANQLQKLVIEDYQQRKNLDDEEIKNLKAERDAWYKAPSLWLGVGFVLGAYLGIEARK